MTQKEQIKILYQPLKTKWYRMIESGEKPEEYREETPYWSKRLLGCPANIDWCREKGRVCKRCSEFHSRVSRLQKRTEYTHVQFSIGYPKKNDTSRRMTFEMKGIEYREGREEWGAEKGKKYLVEVLGKRTTLDGTKLWEEP